MYRYKLALLVVLGCALAAFAASGLNGPGMGAMPKATNGTIDSISGTYDVHTLDNVANYTFTVTGDTDDGGGQDQVQFQIWDDGVMVASRTYDIPVGSTQTISDTLTWVGALGESAPGLGAYLSDLPRDVTLDAVDPYFPAELGAPVPALSPWGIGALVLLLAAAGFLVARRFL